MKLSCPRDFLLVCLNLCGSVLLWSPHFLLDLPFWFPLALILAGCWLSIILPRSPWLWLALASGIGALAGFLIGFSIWPPGDPIAVPLVPYVGAAMAFSITLANLIVGLAVRKRPISGETLRRTMRAMTFTCFALGPVSLVFGLATTPRRAARNERLAAARVEALKDAMERAVKAYGSIPHNAGMVLKPHYFGPPFSSADWQRLTVGNRVDKDGYLFTIHRASGSGYVISASPKREHLDGRRRFCVDESAVAGWRVQWNGARPVCLPRSQ